MKTYRIWWSDAKYSNAYENEIEMAKSFEKEGVVIDIQDNDGDWIDFEAYHEFKAKSDREARELALQWLNNYRINITVFSVVRVKDEKIIMTEEDFK